MDSKIKDICIDKDTSIIDAIKMMDTVQQKLLIVLNNDGLYYSLLSIGDIQRSIIANVALSEPICKILRKDVHVAKPTDDINEVKMRMLERRSEYMPIIDDEKHIVDVIFWKDLFDENFDTHKSKVDIPVVIMAGGKGTRLKPLTNVIPKPLIPIGEKTILEEIMDQFESIGCQKFYMSVNYKSDVMRFYLDQLEHHYDIEFFEETKPLGTIGSVSLLKGKINTPFFVSNCDIIIDQDYRDVYDYHKSNHNDITIVTAIKSFKIPYGVIEAGEDGIMQGLTEKPENTYMINTGVYILQPELIKEIPEGEFFHITDLMEKVRNGGGRVGCFPVSENSWRDMGEWREYLKMIGQ